ATTSAHAVAEKREVRSGRRDSVASRATDSEQRGDSMNHGLFKPRTLEESMHVAVGSCNGFTMQERWEAETRAVPEPVHVVPVRRAPPSSSFGARVRPPRRDRDGLRARTCARNQCFSLIPTAALDSTRASFAVVMAQRSAESLAADYGTIAADVRGLRSQQ